LRVTAAAKLDQSGLSTAALAAIWNGLPGKTPITKFKDRKTAVARLWAAFKELPAAAVPAKSAVEPRADSKQGQVIAMLQRPEGATIEEMATAMGWQRHTVRGLLAGALKKKLGLEIETEKTERGRCYRIAGSHPAARPAPSPSSARPPRRRTTSNRSSQPAS
jgi:hypothetical protein